MTHPNAEHRLPRTPEPELMDSPDQVRAYAEADFAESNQAFVDFLDERFRPRPDSGHLVDLGCGPGDICIRLARALPGWRITGVDAGANMLATARERIAARHLQNRIELVLARLPDPGLTLDPAASVVCNSLLHHLPDPAVLWRAIRELAAPGAWVQVMDLARPDSRAAAEALVEQYSGREPDVLKTDFFNSLNAAWRVDEVRAQLDDAGLDLECRMVSDRHWLVSGRFPA
ncbi:MAG: class I SAM-dependent methyltransferase [Wenzhouxiangellaceae bacterium]|nr:class I SAM-dependent methyltransferase [Wenzhouxiangellaceae bacterium]